MRKFDETIKWLKNQMTGVTLSSVGWSLVEDYSKRLLEGQYDHLAKTDFFAKLKKLDTRQRLGVEFAIYLVNATIVQGRFNPKSPAARCLFGILSDCFPEMGKRILNGDATTDPQELINKLLRIMGAPPDSFQKSN